MLLPRFVTLRQGSDRTLGVRAQVGLCGSEGVPASPGASVRWFGGLAVWRFGGLAVWRFVVSRLPKQGFNSPTTNEGLPDLMCFLKVTQTGTRLSKQLRLYELGLKMEVSSRTKSASC